MRNVWSLSINRSSTGIRIRMRYCIEGMIISILDVSELNHIAMIAAHRIFVSSNAINIFGEKEFAENSKALVEPHVLFSFASHLISPPHVREFVRPECFVCE